MSPKLTFFGFAALFEVLVAEAADTCPLMTLVAVGVMTTMLVTVL